MSDDALLRQLIGQAAGSVLWCVDENVAAATLQSVPRDGRVTVLTNRADQQRWAEQAGLEAVFSDFCPDSLPGQRRWSQAVYRTSKEKRVSRYVLGWLPQKIEPGGSLYLIGHKQEGIKSYLTMAREFWGVKPIRVAREQGTEVWRFERPAVIPVAPEDDYPDVRPLHDGLMTKPGVFGWQKVDAGSALLLDALGQARADTPNGLRWLDLGCGYGYLSAGIWRRFAPAWVSATDNNAAALKACAATFEALAIAGEVIGGDAADSVPAASVDRVICNPPFHRGFEVSSPITEHFLAAASRCLKPGGEAYFVVNAFVPLARKAEAFGGIRELLATPQFKVFAWRC